MTGRFLSEGHAERFDATVWVAEDSRAAWGAGSEMPDGAMLVEELVSRSAKGEKSAGLLVMAKRDGAWSFVSVGPDGDVVDDARTARCAACHRDAPRDFVFRGQIELTAPATQAPPR